jgi:dynein heavy chain
MSPELDEMKDCFLKNKVPNNWERVSYLSLKSLASWFKDLHLRVDFMRNWI